MDDQENKPPKILMIITNQLPLDIIVTEILPKLPAKSLIRFKCVSKSFRTIISSSEFIDRHLNVCLTSNSSDMLIYFKGGRKNNNNIFSLDLNIGLETILPIPRRPDNDLCLNVVCSCNGLLCICKTPLTTFILMNPTTRSCREIPMFERPLGCVNISFALGFAFDHRNNDYKIVGVLDCNVDKRYVMVYSLRSDSWRCIERTSVGWEIQGFTNSTLIHNHLVHYKIWNPSNNNNYKLGIVCFNVCTEKWEDQVPLPAIYDHDNNYPIRLEIEVLDGCLCSAVMTKQESDFVSVWVMKEYGIKESWVILFKASLSHSNELPPFLVYPPIYLRRGSRSQILFAERIVCAPRSNSHSQHGLIKLIWHNMIDKTIERVDEINNVNFSNYPSCVCKASLVSVLGGDQIRAVE